LATNALRGFLATHYHGRGPTTLAGPPEPERDLVQTSACLQPFWRRLVVSASVLITLAASWNNAFTQVEGSIFVSAQPDNFSCVLLDMNPGVHTVHIIHSLSLGAKASRFRIVSGPGMTMTYMSEVHHFPMTVGNTQSGISICYEDCLFGDFLVASMTYMGYGTSAHCSRIQVAGHPESGLVEAMRCNNTSVRMAMEDLAVTPSLGGCACPAPRSIQGTPQDFGCMPVPVAGMTWGAIKALYHD